MGYVFKAKDTGSDYVYRLVAKAAVKDADDRSVATSSLSLPALREW